MGLNLSHLMQMHRRILTRKEKKWFFLLTSLFLITSFFDVVGIGAIGYFLTVMMDPTILKQIPLLQTILPTFSNSSQTLIFLGIIILAVFVLKTCLSCIVQKELVSYCFKVGARIRIQLMEQCLYAPYSYYSATHTSEMINRILNYTCNYANLSLVSFMIMLVHSVFVMVIIAFLILFNPLITLFLIALFSSLLVIYVLVVKNKLYEAGQKVNVTSQQIVKSVQEGLSAFKEVRIFSKENFFLERMRKQSTINAEANGFISIFTKLPFYFLESLMFLFIITLCIAELTLGVNVQSIIALCGVLVASGIRLLPSLYQISVAVINSQSSKHTLEKIYQDLFYFNSNFKEPSWPRHITSSIPQKKSFKTIALQNIKFRYSDNSLDTLSDINLNIHRGQAIGIIGPSGAGKSTLVDILLGLLSPTSGKILLDGQPISEYRSWAMHFAYIPQSIYLLDASIKENIIFGECDTEINETNLKNAVQMAQLQEVIAKLPDGINTMIGENGIKLSGGQRQRIALARAFYHEREIIVMDEATAALDNDTEYEVVEAIKNLHQVKTLIIIAHRYTTVEHCDVIIRLEQGRIIEAGTFSQVLGNKESHN